MKIIDISVSISKKMLVWPGNLKPKIKHLSNINKSGTHNETSISMNSHSGTHIDAPLHFFKDGKTINEIDLSFFIGPAFVLEFKNVKEITSDDLENAEIPNDVERLLLKTSNSLLWNKQDAVFKEDYVGLTSDAAEWLVNKKIKLVGVDYLSVAKFTDATKVHQILLATEIVILEGINLSETKEGNYDLACFPLKISEAEAAPVRAVLLTN